MMNDDFFDDDVNTFESEETDFENDFKEDNYQWDSESFNDDELEGFDLSIDNTDEEPFEGFYDDDDEDDFYQ